MKTLITLLSAFIVSIVSLAMINEHWDPYRSLRKNMVEQQIKARGITQDAVLAALFRVPRHFFIPEENRPEAYQDFPVPIGFQQTISQPFIVGFMTQAADLKKSDRVLEIGTGSGYQTAILAEMAAQVFSIEIIPELAARARAVLSELGYQNIMIKTGDGYEGWPQAAPFDVIVVTAAPAAIPQKLYDQLHVGGRMVIPVGTTEQRLLLIKKTPQGPEQTTLLAVSFVPMVQEFRQGNE